MKKNKRCVAIQIQKGLNVKQDFQCSSCGKILSCRYNLKRHQEICRDLSGANNMIKTLQEEVQTLKQTIQRDATLSEAKIAQQVTAKENELLRKEIQDLKQMLDKHTTSHAAFLQDCTKKAIDKPTTSNTQTNIQTNISLKQYLAENTLTSDQIRSLCEEKATVELLRRGIGGVAKMISPLLKTGNKPMFVITDQSRMTIKSKRNGKIQIDPEGKQLFTTVREGIFPPFQKIFLAEIDRADPTEKKSKDMVDGFDGIRTLRLNTKSQKQFIRNTPILSKNDMDDHGINNTEEKEPEEHKEEQQEEEPPETPEEHKEEQQEEEQQEEQQEEPPEKPEEPEKEECPEEEAHNAYAEPILLDSY